MIRKIFIVFSLLFLSQTGLAQTYDVYDHSTPYPYILRQPNPGVFLGQMMRNIGLKPDWANRSWIRIIHEANPGQVDAEGEILFHTQQLKIPLAALRTLRGYNTLLPKLQPFDPPPVQTQVVVEEPPVQVVEAKEEEPEYQSGLRFDIIAGGGSENFKIDDGVANRSELFTEVDAFLKLDLQGLFKTNHQWGLSFQTQVKTYEAPASVGYNPDAETLFEVRYHYGYQIFNGVFLNFVGQHKQFNVATFLNTAIFLETYMGHSLGVGADIELFDIVHKVVSMYIDIQAIYADTLDTDTDTGIYSSLEFKVEPKSIDSGFILGARLNYYSHPPSGYDDHSSVEGLGFIGYAF